MLERLADVIWAHPWKIIAVSALLLAVTAWLAAFRLGVVNNVNDLIREDSTVHKNFIAYQKEFDVREEMVVMIASDDPAQNRGAAEFLGSRFVLRTDDFTRVYYRHDFSRMEPKLLHYADMEQLEEIRSKLAGYAEILSQPGSALDLNSMLREVNARFDEKYLRRADNWQEFMPFMDEFAASLDRLARELERKPEQAGNPEVIEPEGLDEMRRMLVENEYVAFDDGKIMLIMLTPTEGDSTSFSPYGESIARLRSDIDEARTAFPGVEIGLTGEPVMLDDELRQTTKDSIIAAIITFVLISILFFLSYHEIIRPAMALVTLVIALVWTLGLTALTVGHLNVISQACVIMIMGLGIDFGIQMTGRYEEELRRQHSEPGALRTTLSKTGLAILTGGSTTAAAFFTMCFNEFIGLAELGIIAGSGMVMCVIANLTLLPAFFVVRDRRRRHEIERDPHVRPAFREQLDREVFSRPRLALGIVAAVSVVAAFGINRITYDYNLLNLQSDKMESIRVIKKMILSPSIDAIFGVVVADHLDEAAAKAAELEALPSVRQVRTLSTLLPRDTEAKTPLLAEIATIMEGLSLDTDVSKQVDVARARRDLNELLQASREGLEQAQRNRGIASLAGQGRLVENAIETFGKIIPPLERASAALRGLNQAEAGRRLNHYQVEVFGRMQRELQWLKEQNLREPATVEDLPAELQQRYQSPNGKILIEIDPLENVWEEEPNRQFVADLYSVDPAATGTPVQNFQYINLLRDSYLQAAWMAFAAILVLTWMHFRHPGRVLLTLLPLGLGILWMLGIMGWFQIAFNPANIITIPLVIGIGVAFGVYVVDRHREEGEVRLFGSSTGKAIMLSAATTITGFASMMTGQHVGLVSLGLVMTIGIVCCFLAAVFVLPQILSWHDSSRARTGKESPTSN